MRADNFCQVDEFGDLIRRDIQSIHVKIDRISRAYDLARYFVVVLRDFGGVGRSKTTV